MVLSSFNKKEGYWKDKNANQAWFLWICVIMRFRLCKTSSTFTTWMNLIDFSQEVKQISSRNLHHERTRKTQQYVEHLEYILKKLKKDQLLVNGMNNEFAHPRENGLPWTCLVSDKNQSQPKKCWRPYIIKHLQRLVTRLKDLDHIKRFSQLEKAFLDLSKKELTIPSSGGTISSYGGVSEFSTFLCDL